MDGFDVEGVVKLGKIFLNGWLDPPPRTNGLALSKPATQSVGTVPQSPFPSFVLMRPEQAGRSPCPRGDLPFGPHFFQIQSAFAGFCHTNAAQPENAFSPPASQPQ
jgi:hypothetical protein